MNENVLSFVKWAGGIVITLAIISIAFFIFGQAKAGTMDAADQISEVNQQIAESDKLLFDGQKVPGSDVVNAIRKFEDETIGIKVVTKKSTVSYVYTFTEASGVATLGAASSSSLSDAMNESGSAYIEANALFKGTVLRDQDGVVIAIRFEQE